jgi:hypothetical protein
LSGAVTPEREAKVLALVAASTDPDQLRRFREAGRREGSPAVARAAFERLVEILPEERPGTVEHDFWRTIHAFEEVLSEERGRTTRLSRTRQKVGRVGIRRTLEDFATASKPTDSFGMLIERDLADLTGEAVILRHPDAFEAHVLEAAERRLSEAGVDVAASPRA